MPTYLSKEVLILTSTPSKQGLLEFRFLYVGVPANRLNREKHQSALFFFFLFFSKIQRPSLEAPLFVPLRRIFF